jgi:two-component system chemotaxis sensor kinase CheA
MPEHAALEPSTLSTSDLSAFAADSEMVAEFITESREHIAGIEEKMLLIEKDGSDLESVNAVFRGVHTIKGLAGFLELKSIQDISHEVETLLDHVRCRRLSVTPALVDSVFSGIDFIRIEIERLQRHIAGEEAPPPTSSAGLLEQLRSTGSQAVAAQESGPTSEVSSRPEPDAQPTQQMAPALPAHEVSEGMPGDEARDEAQKPAGTAPPAPPARRDARPPVHAQSLSDDRSLRIETSKLDHLMNMVGELVIAQTLVANNPQLASIQDPRLLGDLALLNRIATEVQRTTTSLRMVPIGAQFQKTARVVRDLSRQLGKQIELVTSGEDTELDKTIAEALSGPLLHMVRNSVDHGIETPQERELTSKDPTAQIRLSAYHKSAQIVIEVGDDGRGLDRNRILAKAIERGLVAEGSDLSDTETFQLIFEPGFSTAEKLTEISGRGVGMDVVMRHVQRLRGRIDIQSTAGIGTTFFLRLPLTLGIIDCLVVAVGGGRYILPLYSVSEIFCPVASQLSVGRIAGGHTGEMVTLRGMQLPVVRLHRRFDLTPRTEDLTNGVLLLSEAHGRHFCLFVDEMIGKQEIVIKSLGDTFRDLSGLMGCAILADGQVGLILDVEGIYRPESHPESHLAGFQDARVETATETDG